MVELPHIRQRHLYVTHRRRTIRQIQRRVRCRRWLAADTQQQRFHVEARRRAAGLDDTLHLVEGMVVQQVQDADIVLDAMPGAMLTLQITTQLVEHGRQLPVPKNVGMVQGGRPALQRVQVMSRVEDLLMLAVTTRVCGDHLALLHDVKAFDVGFDRYGLEGGATRHAVAIGVVADHLVLVGLGRLQHARVEGVRR